MSSPRIQTVEEFQSRLSAIVMSARFAVETNGIIAMGRKLLKKDNDENDAILAGIAILTFSYQQNHNNYTNKHKDDFNKRFGTRGFYPISYSKLKSQFKFDVLNENVILAVGKAALAKKIPFNYEMFAGCGIWDKNTSGIQASSDKALYQRLYQQQESDRMWRKIGRAFLVVLSAIPLIFPAYFTYKWMKRKNKWDVLSKAGDEIQMVRLSKGQYETYVGSKESRKQFKAKHNLNEFKVEDKPKKCMVRDKAGNASMYMDINQKARFDFFSENKASQYVEGGEARGLIKHLPAASCTTLRHR